MWAREELFKVCGGRFGTIWVLGGWYGVMAAMLFDDLRFEIDEIDSIDIDADVAKVAATLNEGESRFHASTRDMYVLDYVDAKPELIINTSCEHIADVRGWLRLLPKGTKVLLQSNDYFAEPTHISCVTSQETFEALAGLEDVWFSGTLAQKKYNRFMLIGAV
jgi:hypothetical protein